MEAAVSRFLRCPACESVRLAGDDTGHGYCCESCGAVYPWDDEFGFASMLPPAQDLDEKSDIKKWWGDLYQQLYSQFDNGLTRDTLIEHLESLEDMFRRRRHMCAEEMPLQELAGKKVLEIGSGGGGHSALFALHGANVTAVDITPERVASTALKLNVLGAGGRCFQADAEHLPFQADSFDIVYSNGVLHHSKDTETCIAEVFRVLKPGGKAIVMLYSRHSSVYWMNIVPRGLITGEMFRWPEAEWVGRLTEGRPKFGTTRNPYTRIYSAQQMKRLFDRFDIQSLRKSSFQFDNFCVPKLTQMRNAVLRAFGRQPDKGGIIVYGAPFMSETALEVWLGQYIGFAWNIVATKPAN
jgi:ubiquinone/menaquinone biosynthesis C-methylase UbiE